MPDPALVHFVATTVRAPQHVHEILKHGAALSGVGIGAYLRESGLIRTAWLLGTQRGELTHDDARHDPHVAQYVDEAVKRWLDDELNVPALGTVAELDAPPGPAMPERRTRLV